MSDNKVTRDWLIRCYNESGSFPFNGEFIIKDRTEHEAEREAESDPRVLEAFDWTIVPIHQGDLNHE
jgi:hypothetical protein